MINSINVHSLRGLQNVSVPNLGPVNVIVGPNSCGKTSLLQALFVLCLEGQPGKLLEVVRYSGFEGGNIADPPKLSKGFEWLFPNKQYDRPLLIEGVFDDAPREVQVELQSRKSRPAYVAAVDGAVDVKIQDLSKLREQADIVVSMHSRSVGVTSSGSLYIGQASVFGEESSNAPPIAAMIHHAVRPFPPTGEFTRLWSNLDEARQTGAIVGLLREFDPEIEDVRVAALDSGQAVLRVRHGSLGIAPLGVFGDGLASALRLATIMASGGVSVQLIDEFDHSLHVGSLERVVQFVYKSMQNRMEFDLPQLFFTTHRLDTLDLFVEMATRYSVPLRVIQMSARKGTARAKVYTETEAASLRDELSVDLRRP